MENNIAKARNDFVVLLVGAQQLEVLEDYVKHALEGKVPKWLRIVAPRQCAADYYGAADLFLSASRWEGFPYAVLEAMVNKLPIISSDIRGLEWAKGAEGVRFFASCDLHELIASIHALLNSDKQEHLHAGKANHDFAVEGFSVRRWAQNILDYYSKLTRAHGDSTPNTQP